MQSKILEYEMCLRDEEVLEKGEGASGGKPEIGYEYS